VQPRSRSLAFEHSDLVAQCEDFESGVGSRAQEDAERPHNTEQELEHELTLVTRRNAGSVAVVENCATH
jgi:hypothetical protein